MVDVYDKGKGDRTGVQLENAYYYGELSSTATYDRDDDTEGIVLVFDLTDREGRKSLPDSVVDWHDDDPSEGATVAYAAPARISIAGDNNSKSSNLAKLLDEFDILPQTIEHFTDAETRRRVQSGDQGLSWTAGDVDELLEYLEQILGNSELRLNVQVRDNKDESGVTQVEPSVEEDEDEGGVGVV